MVIIKQNYYNYYNYNIYNNYNNYDNYQRHRLLTWTVSIRVDMD